VVVNANAEFAFFTQRATIIMFPTNYIQRGEGSPVILAHGFVASLRTWDDLLPEIAEAGYAGYALDLLGHGESYKPARRRDYTFNAVFDHFAAWIDSLRLTEPLTLVGHSLGGGLSLQYALLHPERVRGLALVNPFYDFHQLAPVVRFAFQRRLLNADLIGRTPYRLFRLMVDATSFRFDIDSREAHTLPEHVRIRTALDYTRSATGVYNIPHTLPNFTPRLARIQQPTLLVWGRRDSTLAPDSFPRMSKLLPNIIAEHALPSCGHVPHRCHPEKVNPCVIEFLKQLG